MGSRAEMQQGGGCCCWWWGDGGRKEGGAAACYMSPCIQTLHFCIIYRSSAGCQASAPMLMVQGTAILCMPTLNATKMFSACHPYLLLITK
ncbi:hypothetical protein GDO81_014173 [Engystomops pustulosus]|uniref:Uncharacterized protein n=1 Tax=Engystomops pustulosus TaxID=76066 RepID=A0AAV7B8M1_ENGPU|nr:hypothetical protein GDO81_014173 [Engystomops pustulosus]